MFRESTFQTKLMKKTILFLFLTFMIHSAYSQTTVTIGTGTATQKQPFGMWAAYERSASIYLSSEIGSFGSYGMMINTLAWNVGTADQTTCPSKIYLRSTGSSTLSAVTWASLISNATLVYDASTNFTTAGWRTIDIADFTYTTGNLMVLCETNYGGSGATSYPVFKYSYFPSKHEFWYDYILPTGSGTVNENRPNIQVTYTTLTSSIVPPSGFMAVAVSSSQVNLNWKKNGANDNVMIAYNVVNTFGVPSGSYVAGDDIAGGGTVIYNGSGASYSQASGLSPGTTYYYKAWSVHQPVPGYSIETGSTATTQCDVVATFPYIAAFEEPVFPPPCWSLSALPWLRSGSASGYGTGSASTFANFFNTSAGDFEIISPELDFGSLGSPTVTFDHAYATYETQVDKLELWASADHGATYLLASTWLGGINGPLNTGGAKTTAFVPTSAQWATKSCALPAGTNKVMFRGTSGYGNNLFLDNITFHGDCNAPTTLYADNITSSGAELGWTPAGTALAWEIIWGNPGFDPLSEGQLIPGVTTIPYLLEGLQPGQACEFYVKSDCGGSFSSWSGPVSFTTTCETVNIPFFENFDNFTPPGTGCQAVTDNNSDAIKWIGSTLYPGSLPNSMYLNQSSSLAMDDWFFSPGLNLTGGITYTVNFIFRSDGAGLPDKLELKWGTGNEASAMTGGQIWHDAAIQAPTYTDGSTTFTPGSSGVFYLGWHGYSPAGSGFLCVDDIAVDEASVSWNGAVSSDWEDPLNWTPQVVPNRFQNVTISSGMPNNPTVNFPGPACMNLTLDPNTMITISPDGEITVNGNLTIRETASLDNYGMIIIKGNLDNQNPD